MNLNTNHPAEIRLCGVTKIYDNIEVIQKLDMKIIEGSLTVILGPSGSGKTTFLNIIAGLENIDSGKTS